MGSTYKSDFDELLQGFDQAADDLNLAITFSTFGNTQEILNVTKRTDNNVREAQKVFLEEMDNFRREIITGYSDLKEEMRQIVKTRKIPKVEGLAEDLLQSATVKEEDVKPYKSDEEVFMYHGTPVKKMMKRVRQGDTKVQEEVALMKTISVNQYVLHFYGMYQKNTSLCILLEHAENGNLHDYMESKPSEMDWSVRLNIAFEIGKVIVYNIRDLFCLRQVPT